MEHNLELNLNPNNLFTTDRKRSVPTSERRKFLRQSNNILRNFKNIKYDTKP